MFYLWHESYGGSDFSRYNSGLYSWLLITLPAFFGASGEVITKGIVVLCLSISGFSLYYVCIFLRKSFMPSVIAGVFYMFTPWIFNKMVGGGVYPMIFLPMLPIVWLLFKESVSKHEAKFSLLCGILLSFAGAPLTVLSVFLLVFYSLIDVIASKDRKIQLFANIKSLSIIICVLLAIYSYWLIPFLIGGGGTGIPLSITEIIVRSRNTQLINVIRLTGNVQPFYLATVNGSLLWVVTSFLLTSFIWLAPVVRRNKNVLFFALLALMCIFLGTGINAPGGSFYTWAYLNVPYFQAFRQPYTFLVLASLAYSYLLCESIEWSIQHFYLFMRARSSRFVQKHSRKILASFLFCLIILNSYPFWLTGDLGGSIKYGVNIKSNSFPEEFHETNNWLTEQGTDFKVIWFTLDPRIRYDWAPWGQVNFMAVYSQKPSFGPTLGNSPDERGRFTGFLASTMYENKTDRLGELLALGNVKYIVLSNYVHSNDLYYMLGAHKYSYRQLEYTIRHQNDLSLVKTYNNTRIYENNHYGSKVFSTSSASILTGGYSSLISLGYIDEFNLRDSCILFADQLSPSDHQSIDGSVNNVIISNGNLYDLVFSYLPEEFKISPYATNAEYNFKKHWSLLHYYWWWHYWPYLDTVNEASFTRGTEVLTLPFSVPASGNYSIWLKLFYGHDGSTVKLEVDGRDLNEVNTYTPSDQGYSWIHVGDVTLLQGGHVMSFVCPPAGENILAGIIAAPDDRIQEACQAANELLKNKGIMLIYELKSGQEATPLSRPFETSISILIPKTDDYNIYLRAKGNTSLKTKILNYEHSLTIDSSHFKWYKIEELYLEKGNYTFSLNSDATNEVRLDQLLVKSSHFPPHQPDNAPFPNVQTTYQKRSPVEYSIQVNAQKPFFLVLSESFHVEWKAYVNGKEIKSIPVYSFLNGYFITETGSYEITLKFAKQQYYEIGRVISLLTFFIVISYLITGYLRRNMAHALTPTKLSIKKFMLKVYYVLGTCMRAFAKMVLSLFLHVHYGLL